MNTRALLPLTPLYAAGVWAKNLGYERGWLHAKRLAWPVVSVGNLSVGGSGKTPLVIRIAELLTARSINVDVLSRGYGRNSTLVERVQADGDADRFGDEPLLIARHTGVPVYVGSSRYKAGLLAERDAGQSLRVHLLDDGFQHRQLARNVDIVVLHRSDFEQTLLPSGRLREPLSSLHRASFLVLRAEDCDFETKLRKMDIQKPVWITERQLEVPLLKRAVAFCGIARPDEFFQVLRQKGVELVSTCAFRDHHHYVDEDMDRLVRLQEEYRAEAFMTTEKDDVRLSSAMRAKLQAAASFHTAKLVVSLQDENQAISQMLALLVRK